MAGALNALPLHPGKDNVDELEDRISIMPFVRLAAATMLFAALLIGAFADASAATPDVGGVITSIYAHGHEDAVWTQWLDSKKRGAWLSRDLTALWAQCDALARKSKDELGPLDFDVATNSQMGWEAFKGFKVSVVSEDDGRAVVNARLKTGPDTVPSKFVSDNVIGYDLVREGDAWKIDDVRSTTDGKPWTLRGLLKDYLKN